ncbi:hypothetical protein DYB37_004367 [Aphanomyces astaci]|uniref:Helicase ATP-binding domain-containing protein n=1 Tax=Aphanomyces astaci TaxID=112090 RepID=A0A418F2H9_APHAT|nr:hypothetical protein DYB35_003653 [Aphanomyces astaci]RHZ22807.1 hypothetical protein DYB37_004367 [Aphanomyces astaci]
MSSRRRQSAAVSLTTSQSRTRQRQSSIPNPFTPSTCTSPLRIHEPSSSLSLTGLEKAQLLELAHAAASELLSYVQLLQSQPAPATSKKIESTDERYICQSKTAILTGYSSIHDYKRHMHPYAFNAFHTTSTLCAIHSGQDDKSVVTVKWSAASSGPLAHDRDFCYVESRPHDVANDLQHHHTMDTPWQEDDDTMRLQSMRRRKSSSINAWTSLKDMVKLCKVCTTKLKWYHPTVKCKAVCKPCTTHCEVLLKASHRVCLRCNAHLASLLAKSEEELLPVEEYPEDTCTFLGEWDESMSRYRMVPAPQRRSSRLAPPPDQGASSEPPPSRKRKPTTADTATLATTTAPKKQRANEPVSVLETHTTASIVKPTRKGMPAPTRRSARTAIHDDDDCIVRETDDDDGDIKSDTDIVSASGDDNDAPSSSTAPAVRRRASRVKNEAEEQVAPVPLTRRNQPKRGVGGGALPVEPKVERTFEKPKQRRPRPSKHQVLDDNDSSDFVKDDVKTLRPPPFQASTSSSIPRLTADGGDIMSDDNRPEAAKLGKQGRAKRVVRAIPVRQAPTTLKPLSKNAQGKRKAAAVGARRPSKQLQDSSDGGDSSEFVASSSSDEGSGDDDDVADWASTLKAKAARGKDLVDGSSSSYDDNAPIKSIKRPKTGRSPKKPAAAALTEHAQGNDGGDGGDGGVVRRAEPIEYPYYEVAYAPTGRARHIECTLLNNDVAKPLHGFDALDRDDVDRVQAYMVTNSKLAQEASKYRGGILADEMGMGKTIQAIATMLENVKIKQFHGMVMGGGTLIICPVIACMQVEWTRIILDEAHYIKCSTARSVFRLKSQYKWCLSGTPLQNRIGELFSLVRFLQVDPQAYYECAECDCKQLDFSIFHGHCKHCDHTAMQHYSFFNKKIVTPIQGFGYVAEGKLAMLRLQNDLLRHSIYTQSKAQFNTYVSAGTLLNNYAHIFDLLIRLRQAVDHPYLV